MATANKAGNRTVRPDTRIPHDVLDSPSYRALTAVAVMLLIAICRQLNGKNNGQLQATFSFCKDYHVTERSLPRAIALLIKVGLIYRTKSAHGGSRQWARYAVTWLPIQDSTGIFTESFEPEAWRNFA
jgi:hypothetical protein